MKKLFIIYVLLSVFASGQELTSTGITPAETLVKSSQKEIFEKVKTFASEYLKNDKIEITGEEAGKSLTMKGEANHRACFINQTMGSKTCFNLLYTLKITAQENSYTFEVPLLKAESDRYPEADYKNWFDESGNPVPALNSAIQGTSEYFQSINKDINQYIEEGEYW